MSEYQIKDTGAREQHDSGAVRNVRKGKGRFDLISPVGLKRLAVVYEKGCELYSERNWEKGMPVSRFLDSAARHINDYLAGESTEDHLAQAAWNLFAAMHFEELRPDLQDIHARIKEEDFHFEEIEVSASEEVIARADELEQTKETKPEESKPSILKGLGKLILGH